MPTTLEHIRHLTAQFNYHIDRGNWDLAVSLADRLAFAARVAAWHGPDSDWVTASAKRRESEEANQAAVDAGAFLRHTEDRS